MKMIKPKGTLEWKIILDVLGFTVVNEKIVTTLGKTCKCTWCGKELTLQNLTIMRNKNKVRHMVCDDEICIFEEVMDDEDDENIVIEYNYAFPEEFIEKTNAVLKAEVKK